MPKKKYPKTMSELGASIGVSQAAVSVVLRQERGLPVKAGRMRFSEKTRQKILDAINETGYMPNSIGTALVSGKSSLIGLLAYTISNSSFLPETLEAIEDLSSSHHYGSLLMTTRGNPDCRQQALEIILEKRVDGLIVMDYADIPEQYSKKFADMGIPIVHLFRIPHKQAGVRVDGKKVGFLGMDHLMKLGHRHVCCLYLAEGEYQGACLAAKPYNAPITRVEGRTSQNPPAQFIDTWMNLPKTDRPSAIFSHSDKYAIELINRCIQVGIKVPEELSIIGVDNIAEAATAAVPLTTLHQPKYEQGEAAAKMLFDMIDGSKPDQLIFQPKLVVRESTGKYNN